MLAQEQKKCPPMEVIVEVRVPRHILEWIDENRGSKSRAAYVVDCVEVVKEMCEKKQADRKADLS